MKSEIIFTNKVAEKLDSIVDRLAPASVFVLVDVNTASFVLPRLREQSRAGGPPP